MEQRSGILKLATLSFASSAMEKAFWNHFHQMNLGHGRMCHLLAIFFYAVDGVRDLVLFPQGLPGVWFIRCGVIVPLFAGGLVLSYLKPSFYQKIWQPLFAVYFLATGAGAIGMIILTPSPVNQWLYIGLIYCLMFGYTFLRLRFVLAAAVGILLTAGYIVISLWVLKFDTDLLWIQFPFVMGINILGMFVAYMVEYNFKNAFYLRWLNDQQRKELDAANANLENQVRQRTLELEDSNRMLKANVDALHASESQRNKLEIQLRQAGKLEAIGTLAGGIAHDFNNILTGIFGYSQLAQMHSNDSEKIKNYVHQIIKSAEQASKLVKQILTFSRQSKNEKQPLSLFVLVKETLKQLRASIPTTIVIRENIQSKAMILADPSQIHQVLMNLFTNAYNAMDTTGGVLTVGLSEVDVSESDIVPGSNMKAGRYLKLEVCDTGHGMDQTIQNRIFDPYFTTKRMGKGTGLGLSTVDGIVLNHNGWINLTSEVDKGSTFHVFLPIVDTGNQSPLVFKT